MKKKWLVIMMTLVIAVVAAACGEKNTASNGSSTEQTTGSTATTTPAAEQTELEIKHKLGTTKVKLNPQKVVVFDFGALDTLDKLGVPVAGVPRGGNVPGYLAKYNSKEIENVGGLKEPDFEKINDMKPDLILISGRQSDAYKELSAIAPTVYVGVDTKNYMVSFKENVKILSKIFGKEAEADKELAAIDDSIKALNEKATASGKNALIILANEGKISAYGPKSRFGILHDVFGMTAVDPKIEVSTHGQSVSFEYIAEKNPDYLFVVDRGAVVKSEAGASSVKDVVENALVKNTKASKDGNIVYLNPEFWYLSGGGLESVAEMVKEVSKSLK
ncbi:siderophore ABC transporter substrate-binding protein [Paenibacillus sp. UMB4589-SE434]|uniref:siderophore ABC transporter substrate-binding protein n=1 Tax=Paenibacillus sp. UMB4589-SE434 TaxID=3046314 RepID=UPI00254D0A21|nr:siderophore ABC transporter substrate-binding protein [Paenibacillus sp. UMB4589-SE434]MDK8181406.1 siderophore ABC transporter substrate-binding protein [Paenibacillus sp. UMB4589-SE434]